MPSLFPPTPFTTFAVHPVHYFIKLNLLVRKITFFSLILPLRVHEHDDDVNVREEGGVGGKREERGTEGIYSLYMSAGRYTHLVANIHTFCCMELSSFPWTPRISSVITSTRLLFLLHPPLPYLFDIISKQKKSGKSENRRWKLGKGDRQLGFV